MAVIRALFWDVGGVLLTNAWDHTERSQTLEHFGVDQQEFHVRHEAVVSQFERGHLTLDEYLDRTVFYCSRPFTRQAFREFMYSLSRPLPGVIEFAQRVSDSGKYLMATINNESRELNLHRIEKFGLRNVFRFFVSSCFVDLRKPDSEIYRLAMETTQMRPEECCFIDDRAANLEFPVKMGMHGIQMQTLEQLRADLATLGVGVPG